MENETQITENEPQLNEDFWKEAEKRHRRGKIAGGLLLVAIGSLFLAREVGVNFPAWLLTWKTLLIGIAIVIGIKTKFKSAKWLFPLFIGGAFLFIDFYPGIITKAILWSALLIFIGLIIIFKPRNKHWRRKKEMWRHYKHHKHNHHSHKWSYDNCYSDHNEDRIDFSTFMGGVQKNVISKNFKGGKISNVFGGTEINLSQADFEGTAVLEVSNIFGGTKLIIPSNWKIQSELTSVMGSVEDNRHIKPNINEEINKTLILKGSSFMGGIEITNY